MHEAVMGMKIFYQFRDLQKVFQLVVSTCRNYREKVRTCRGKVRKRRNPAPPKEHSGELFNYY